MAEIIGYARVSTTDQSLDIQLDKFKEAGCDKVFSEKKSGLDATRPELKNCMEYVREGDTLVVTRLDRLARSVSHLASIIDDLDAKGVHFRALDQSFRTDTSEGKLMMHILGAFSSFEHSIRAERQAEGIAKAKANNVAFGRPKSLTKFVIDQVKQLKADKVPIYEIERRTSLSRASIYRALKL